MCRQDRDHHRRGDRGLPGRRIQRLHHPDAGNRRRGQPRRAQGVRRPVRIRFEERQGSSDRRLCQGQRHDQRILRPDRAQRELRHEALRQGRGPEGLHRGVPEDRHRARKPGKHADRAAGRLHRFGRVQHEQVRRDRTRGIEQAVPQPHRQGPQGRRRNRCRIPAELGRIEAEGVYLDDGSSRNFLDTKYPGQRRHAAAVPVERPAGARGREGHVHQARRARLPQQRVALPADRTPDRRQRRRAAGDVHQHPQRHARSAAVGGDIRLATFNVLNYFSTTADETGCSTSNAYTDRDGNPVTAKNCDVRGAWDKANMERSGRRSSRPSTTSAPMWSRWRRSRTLPRPPAPCRHHSRASAATTRSPRWSTRSTSRPAKAPGLRAHPQTVPDLDVEDVIRTAFIYKPAKVATVGETRILTDSDAFNGKNGYEHGRQPDARRSRPRRRRLRCVPRRRQPLQVQGLGEQRAQPGSRRRLRQRDYTRQAQATRCSRSPMR